MGSGWVALLAATFAVTGPAPDQSIDVGGRRLHLNCMGDGRPTVILTAGMGESGENWRSIQPRLAKTTRVCAWDRAGLGSSDPSPDPQDVSHTTADLQRLLKAAHVIGPYVLVGHSIGSFESLLLAYREPNSVVAMVLVDPSSPFQNRRFAAVSPAFAKFNYGRLKERTTLLRECASALRSGKPRAEGCSNWASAEAIASMTENWDASSAQLTKAKRSLGDIPLIVLTAGKRAPLPGDLDRESPKVAAEWSRMHDELAAFSTRGENRQVPAAGHYIHIDQPDVVIHAIEEAVAAARASARR